MAICLLRPEDLDTWGKTEKRPNCEFHRHAPYKKVLGMIERNEAFIITGQRAAVVYSSLNYVWKPRYSSSFIVMQMVPHHR